MSEIKDKFEIFYYECYLHLHVCLGTNHAVISL